MSGKNPKRGKEFREKKKGKLAASPESKVYISSGSPVASVIPFIHKVLVLYAPEATAIIGSYDGEPTPLATNHKNAKPERDGAKRNRLWRQVKRARYLSASTIARQLCTATGRQVSRFTNAGCLHKDGLFTHFPECCISLKVGHWRHYLERCKEHKNWTSHQWSRIFFTDQSCFNATSNSQCQLIRRDVGTQFHDSNITETDRYVVVVWINIMLNERIKLLVFDKVSVTRWLL
ncbi:transposable element Tcb2 transposase [Trichonephila clavipes]|nr:transposable element Tcb2 transposase [Trichonephila clavipes]